MKKLLLFVSLFLFVCLLGFSAKTWTVDDNRAECPNADFTHPQDAINAASPGDTIKIYPGDYYGKLGPYNDTPILVVYKDGLSIVAADPDVTKTVLHFSLGSCTPENMATLTGGAVITTNSSPCTCISIIASDVTISGLSLITPEPKVRQWNESPLVLIGELYWGDTNHFGSDNNTITKCTFADSVDFNMESCCGLGILISHSSGNLILDNKLGSGVANYMVGMPVVMIEDGSCGDSNCLAYSSKDNRIINNEIAYYGGISVGCGCFRWGGVSFPVNNSGTKIHGNQLGGITFFNSYGLKIASGNVSSLTYPDQSPGLLIWIYNSSDYKIPGNANHDWPPGWVQQYLNSKGNI